MAAARADCFSNLRIAAIGFVFLIAANTPPVLSAQADLKTGLKTLFDAGWSRTTKGRDAAQREYDRLRAVAPKDASVRYAYALVQLRQLRYPDAAKLMGEVVAADKTNAAALKFKIWLAAVTKEYPEALASMERLIDLLPREDAAGKAETPHRETVAFLGRMCGYFEGPGQDSVDELLAVKCRQRITDQLSTARRAVFEEARRNVVGQFTGTAKAIGEKAAESEAEATKQRERDLAELQGKAEKTAAEIKEMEARNEKLKLELDSELQKFAQREQPIITTMQQIEVQAAPLRNDIRSIDNNIAYSLDAAGREKDPVTQQMLLNNATNYRLQRNQLLGTLDVLTRRYAALGNDLAVVQQQKQVVLAKFQREVGRVDVLRRTLDRTRNEANRLSGKSITGNTPLVRDQKRKAGAFSTYVPLPISLEEERDRLLEAVR
jgi:hypothetical protein